MSWINSNATYKQNSKNDLSFYHGFSKTPVEPTSSGTAATTLANASTKGGHTVIGTEVWAEEIPWFGLVASRAAAVTRLSGLTKLNDLVKVDGEGGKVYKYIGTDDATFTEDTWADFWTEVTLTNGMTLNNRHNQPVLRYYLNQPMQTLTTTNNASIDSKGFATRLFVDESTHVGQTSGGSVVSQFAAGTDNIKNGIPSVELNPKLYYGTTEKIAGTHYYDYNVSGTVLWNENVASRGVKISCFRYIGKTVTGQLSSVDSTVKTHTNDISLIKAQLGMGGGGEDGTPSVTERVDANETALKILLGLESGDEVVASESIATTAANAVSAGLATGGNIATAIATAKQEALDAINAIQHFSVVVVPEGQTMESITPVENTIYLVSDTNAADGSYIEYIAFKQGETVVTEKIGSTKIDLSGYATVETVNGVDARLQTAEGQIATITSTDATKEGSIAKALADAKTYAEGQAATAKSDAETTAANALSAARTEITAEIAQAKSEAIASAEVTITAGTGIVVTGEGKGTTFQIAVSDDVATAAALSALSQVVASNKTELEGKIAEASAAATAALETAVAEIGTTTTGLDTRLTAAEGNVTALQGEVAALISGENSVDSKITAAKTELEGKITTAQNTLQGNIDGVSGRVDTIVNETIPGVKAIAEEAKGLAETAVQSASGDDYVALDKSGTAITATTNITAIDTALAAESATVGGAIKAAADAAAKAADDASKALETAQAQTLDQTGTLEGMFSVATAGSVGTGIESITITDTGLSTAISAARTDAVADVKALTLSATDTDDAGKVTVTLGGTVETPTLTVTSSDIASAQTLADLVSTVNTHIAEAAGLYLSVEKVDTLPADADAKTNKIYLVPVDTEAGRAQNIHTEYIWTNGKWEIIGTTAIDINSLEAAADAAQSTADTAVANAATAQAAAEAAQGEVDALETVVETLTQTHADDKAALEASIDEINTTIEELDATETVNGLTVTQVNGKITGLTETLITASVPEGTTSVEGNIAYVGSTKNVIAPEKFQTAAQMPETLTTWVADLSNLTVGDNMFNGTALTTFIGDLSSLTSGVDMFAGCSLTVESVEFIADTLPTVTSGTITLGTTTEAHAAAIADIQAKGWTVA